MDNNEERYSIEKIEELSSLVDTYDNAISETRLSAISVTISTAAMAINTANFFINYGYTNSGLVFGGVVGALTLTFGGYDAYLIKHINDLKMERNDIANELIKEEAVNEVMNHIRGGK